MGDRRNEQGGHAGQRWSLAIFSSRERVDELLTVVRAAAGSEVDDAALTIDVLVNGNTRLAKATGRRLEALPLADGITVRLWSVPLPDKAGVWNRYLHALLPQTDLAFFIDGYVSLAPDALRRMADALRCRPRALAATCVPSMGRTAPALRRQFLLEGGFHGNLYALPAATCAALRASAFLLPTGIYRNDSALGAALAFNLDPAGHDWRWDRIVVVPDARYAVPVPHPLRVADVRGAVRRRMRQAQGALETRALQSHLAQEKQPPSAWPRTAQRLILDWARRCPDEARRLAWRDPLAWMSLRRLRRRAEKRRVAAPMEFLGRYPAVVRRGR